MTDSEQDECLGHVVTALLRKFDSQPLTLQKGGLRTSLSARPVQIPLSYLISEAELCNALFDVMSKFKLEFATYE